MAAKRPCARDPQRSPDQAAAAVAPYIPLPEPLCHGCGARPNAARIAVCGVRNCPAKRAGHKP